MFDLYNSVAVLFVFYNVFGAKPVGIVEFFPYTVTMSITVIGTIFTDIKGYPLGTFLPDGRNPGEMKIVHGGVGRNIAEDLGRTGFAPSFVALCDHSGLASEVVSRLEQSGVDTKFVTPSKAGMGTWMAIFNDRGDVAANISVRPDLTPLTALIDARHEEIFSGADSIILEIDIEPETVERVFYYAEKYEKKVYSCISVMSIALTRKNYFPKTACFICNLQEAGMLFGEDLTTHLYSSGGEVPVRLENRLAALARDAGFPGLIVTLGADGAVYIDRENERSGHCPAKNVTLGDSTGAGDAFCAGAAAALTYGKDMAQACRIGSLLASLVITSTENVCPASGVDSLWIQKERL